MELCHSSSCAIWCVRSMYTERKYHVVKGKSKTSAVVTGSSGAGPQRKFPLVTVLTLTVKISHKVQTALWHIFPSIWIIVATPSCCIWHHYSLSDQSKCNTRQLTVTHLRQRLPSNAHQEPKPLVHPHTLVEEPQGVIGGSVTLGHVDCRCTTDPLTGRWPPNLLNHSSRVNSKWTCTHPGMLL